MRTPKDILFVSDNLPPVIGGSATVYENICKNLSHRCVAISSTHYGDGTAKSGTSEYDANSKFTIYRTKLLRTLRRKTKPTFLLRLRDERSNKAEVISKIIKCCSHHNIKTIVIGELITLGWLVFVARYILRKKVVVYTHGEEITEKPNSRRRKFINAYLHHAHHIISVSNFCKLNIFKLYNVNPSRISVISNGVDTTFFTPAEDRDTLRERLGWAGKKVIFSAGRHVTRKGFDYLIEAMPAVLEKSPDAQLWLAGTGPLTQTLQTRVQALHLEKHVIFTGGISREDLLDMYRGCDVFAMPNRTLPSGDTEGFGLVFLEANACGRPALAGQGGGSIEAIFDGVNGLTVSAEHPDNIAEALVNLLNKPQWLDRLGARGLTLARRSNWALKNKQFENLIDLLSSGQSLKNQTPFEAFGPHCTPAAIAPPHTQSRSSLVTIDLEEQFDWEHISPDFEIPDSSWLHSFHEQAVEHGIKPLYVITYQILTSEPYAKLLKQWHKNAECDVGIHLHGWNTPPLLANTDSYYSFQCNIPPELENCRLIALCELFEKTFGEKPRYHRAGRYGVGKLTYRFLQENGIKVDLSPSPPFDYSAIGGVNFRNFSNAPFWVGEQNDVLCLPCSGMRFLRGPDWVTKFTKPYLKEHFGKPVRLSPEGNPLQRLKIMGQQLINSGNDHLIISLHSTSLVPGATPYAATKEDVQNLTRRLFDFVDWAETTYEVEKDNIASIYNRYTKLPS